MKRSSESWRQKLHPLFVECTEAYRDTVKRWQDLGSQPPAEQVAEIEARFREEMGEIRARHSTSELPSTTPDPLATILVDTASAAWPLSQQEMDLRRLEKLYWDRYREPLWIACQKMEAGDMEAYSRIVRVGEDYQRLRFNKIGIKPTKGDPEHSFLLLGGLDLGLNELSAEELADCFDALCCCGRIHDPDALKKQRLRIRHALKKAEEWRRNNPNKMSGS